MKITGADVLNMIIPNGGWVIYGDDFDSIVYDEGIKPISKKEFEDGFTKYELWRTAEANAKAVEKSALLAKLGITEDEAKLLLS